MATQIRKVFDSSHAPQSEIDGVLQALQYANINCYEIPNNIIWGGGAICIRTASQYSEALEVIKNYQKTLAADNNIQLNSPIIKNNNIRWSLAIPATLVIIFFLVSILFSIIGL